MILARRLAVAVAALVGLVVAVLGLSLAIVLGPSGEATFTARATGPVLVGPEVLGGLDVPVTVTATGGGSGATGVFLGLARSGEVADVVGGSRVLRAVEARFPARVLELQSAGSGALPDPSGLDVWRATGRGSLEVAQAGASAVLVVPTGSDPVTVVVTRQHSTWFLEALVAVVVGLIVAGAAAWWLVQQLGHRIPVGGSPFRRSRAPRPAAGPPDPSVTPESVPTSAESTPSSAPAEATPATASTTPDPESRP